MHLEIQDVSFSYRSLAGATKPVITNLTWDIDTGITGLLGPNGCGKTTLMRIIDRSLRESSGEIRANGIRVKTNSQVAKFRRGLGIMPQNPDFVPWMTVEGTLEYLA